jgi:hypothetical protein
MLPPPSKKNPYRLTVFLVSQFAVLIYSLSFEIEYN